MSVVVGDESLPHCPATPSVPAPSLFRLDGQCALVTGGTRGIGQACARALAEAGARVCLVVRPGSDAARACDALPPVAAGKHTSVPADLSDLPSVRDVVPRAVAALGGRLDIFLNAAGIQRRSPATDFAEHDWDDVLTVNLKAAWLLSQQAGQHFVPQRHGKIILLASLLTFQGGLTVPAYAASKGAIGQLVKSLSNEWARHGVQVNAIAPGYVATDMNEGLLADPQRLRQISERIPANRWGAPADFSGPAVFLASMASQYVSGETLVVDGGWMGR